MKYLYFEIKNYRALDGPVKISLDKSSLIPLVGINECGKTTILQAIYCFDYSNDLEYNGNHLSDIKNLYHTRPTGIPTITASIQIKSNEFQEYYMEVVKEFNIKIDEEIGDGSEPEAKAKLISSKISLDLPQDFLGRESNIVIERNLEDKRYRIIGLLIHKQYSLDFHDRLARELISTLPYVLYNDDFMDRPPNFIDIPLAKPKALSGWLAIYERLFNSAHSDYSLFKLSGENDSRVIDSILSDVESTLNKTLSKAWKTFVLSNHGGITIRLKFIPQSVEKSSGRIDIKVVEKIEDRDRHFDVIDRSKGFLWFFNFVMKLEFNPKIINNNPKGTVYLLDEPGSYLHYSAQEKLCAKLVEISKKHGVVIFCTHSHTLLNPALLPLNSIYIVEKDKNKKIKATSLPQMKTKTNQNNAYQPILEALQISAFHFEKATDKIIAVEGIYDKYAIELMLNIGNDVSILPGTNANSIIKNVQFLNAFNKVYIAIWDNDEEGNKSYEEAKKFYGEIESNKFDFLPKGTLAKKRMETMFMENDFKMVKNELGFDSSSTYEKTLSSWFFSKKELKQIIKRKISAEAIENFKMLNKIIEKRFKLSSQIRTGEFDQS